MVSEKENIIIQRVDKPVRAFHVVVDLGISIAIFCILSIFILLFTKIDIQTISLGSWYWLFYFFYYLFFESLYQKTPAKNLTRSMVISNTGGKPSFLQILVRSICRFSPFDVFSFLFGLGQGQHDYFSKTTVIQNPASIKKSKK